MISKKLPNPPLDPFTTSHHKMILFHHWGYIIDQNLFEIPKV